MADLKTDSTIAELDERLQASRDIRRLHEGSWFLNLSYYRGHQWVRFDGNRLYPVTPGEERVTLVDNRLRPAVKTDIAKMTKTQPVWVGVPKDNSDKEIEAARLRQRIFEHYWNELEVRRKLALVLRDQRVMGAGFFKQTYDMGKGPAIDIFQRPDGSVVKDAEGMALTPKRLKQMNVGAEQFGQIAESKRSMGEPVLEYRSPLEIFPDALATEEGLVSCEYIAEESIVSKEALGRRFPKLDLDKLEDDASPSGGILASVYPNFGGRRASHGARGRRGVRVREYWSLPNKDDGKGRHVVWTRQGEMILEERLPYPFLPYAMLAGIPSGEFWPDSSLDDQISPQTELNKVSSQIAENSERFGNPARLRSAESAGQAELDWQGLPGEEVIFHDLGTPGAVPQFLVPPEMPVYVRERIPQLVESLRAISGQFEVSQGTVPEGVTAASAISMLQEANDTQLGPAIAEMENTLQTVGRQLLWQVRAFMKDERMIQIAGEDGRWDMHAFRGTEIGDPSSDEVQVGSGLPQSKAQKQAAIQTVLNMLIQNGQAPEPRELRRILRDFEVGGLEHFFSASAANQSQVNEEHRRLMAGEDFDPNPFDDDSFHADEHADFFKTSAFLERRHTPEGLENMERAVAHWQKHQEKLTQAANNQAMSQMAMEANKAGNMPPDPNVVGAATGGNTELPPQPPIPSNGTAPTGG